MCIFLFSKVELTKQKPCFSNYYIFCLTKQYSGLDWIKAKFIKFRQRTIIMCRCFYWMVWSLSAAGTRPVCFCFSSELLSYFSLWWPSNHTGPLSLVSELVTWHYFCCCHVDMTLCCFHHRLLATCSDFDQFYCWWTLGYWRASEGCRWTHSATFVLPSLHCVGGGVEGRGFRTII